MNSHDDTANTKIYIPEEASGKRNLEKFVEICINVYRQVLNLLDVWRIYPTKMSEDKKKRRN